MNFTSHHLIKQAYASPSLRQNILNKGMICLYCDFSGHEKREDGGIACCLVYNRTIQVSAEKIVFEPIGDSVYGELLAIRYSLDILRRALPEHRPRIANVLTDCRYIARLLLKQKYPKPYYEEIINQIAATLDELKINYPEIAVSVRYLSKHKKNNALHKIAHIAARRAIGK
ncbi:hypothetical protein [Cohnella mopanensis]|uniref:hypothetical protein n=1 Tax=Cohnella mopanensis TaxID=2911966 RepID=UPI001EF80AE2|nr:hypothetical protein [Cohnella mopanensis]